MNRRSGGTSSVKHRFLRTRLGPAFAVIVLVLFAGATTALAIQHLQAGDLVVEAEGGFAPKALPRHEDAPITLHGGGSISTASGGLPPILKNLALPLRPPRPGR